jgi:hypothetical protein
MSPACFRFTAFTRRELRKAWNRKIEQATRGEKKIHHSKVHRFPLLSPFTHKFAQSVELEDDEMMMGKHGDIKSLALGALISSRRALTGTPAPS